MPRLKDQSRNDAILAKSLSDVLREYPRSSALTKAKNLPSYTHHQWHTKNREEDEEAQLVEQAIGEVFGPTGMTECDIA